MPRLSAPLIALALLAALAGCNRPAVSRGPEAAMRDPAVPLYSMAGLDPARLTGRWHEAAHLAPPGTPPCAPGRLEVRQSGAGLHLSGSLCRAGRAMPIHAPARLLGHGRMQPEGEAEAWWVLWADYDNRTLVLASPSGAFASVLDRGRLSGDRLRAAAQMLSYNGYRSDWLRPTP